MTLAGRRIAITRPEPGALGERLTTLGAQVIHVPLIAIDDPTDGGAALRRALARLRSFDWLVVTSANGARRAGPAARSHPTIRLAAVGRATAGVLADAAGRPVDLVPAVERAEGLLAAFPAIPSRVLVAQADRAGRALADGLSAAGHDVEVVIAYRTVERSPTADEAAALAGADAVLLSSGSAASVYAASVGAGASPLVVTIGPVTAGAARRCGLTVAQVAPSPDPDTLVRILASTF